MFTTELWEFCLISVAFDIGRGTKQITQGRGVVKKIQLERQSKHMFYNQSTVTVGSDCGRECEICVQHLRPCSSTYNSQEVSESQFLHLQTWNKNTYIISIGRRINYFVRYRMVIKKCFYYDYYEQDWNIYMYLSSFARLCEVQHDISDRCLREMALWESGGGTQKHNKQKTIDKG